MKCYFLLFTLAFSNCYAQEKRSQTIDQSSSKAQKLGIIKNTRWMFKVGEGCMDYLTIKNTTYEQIDCEMDYTFSGKFHVKNDTLFLTEIDLASNLPGKNKYVVKSQSKWLLRNKKLVLFSRGELIGGKWKYEKPKLFKGFAYSRIRK